MLATAIEVADALMVRGLEARVLSMHTLKPLDTEAILLAARETRALVTLEEHRIIGGLGSAVAEVLSESGDLGIPFKRLGIGISFTTEVGSQEFLREKHGLSVKGILRSVESLVAASEDHPASKFAAGQ
jgi:transketolase